MAIESIKKALTRYPRPLIDYGDREVFIRSLLITYATVVASEPLLELAISKSRDRSSLKAYLTEHLAEECDHAKWLLCDLASIDVQPLKIDWQVAQLVGTQYYLIEHVAPDALLGYMIALECRPSPITDIEALERRYGKRVMRTARYHAEHDISHGSDLLAFVENARHDLDIPFIIENVEFTTHALQVIYSSGEFRSLTHNSTDEQTLSKVSNG